MALGILASCTAQTTRSTRIPEVKDRHNFRDEQEGAFILWLYAASGWAEAVEAGPVGALPRRVVQRSCVDDPAAAALQPA
jgi:hypothetical protein